MYIKNICIELFIHNNKAQRFDNNIVCIYIFSLVLPTGMSI